MTGECAPRCRRLCWCVVFRENGKLLTNIYSAAGGNGSSGKSNKHMTTYWIYSDNIHMYFANREWLLSSTRYQKNSVNKSHM